jgi:predicted RNase H-like nuclease
MSRVLGVDACRSGWVGISLSSTAPVAWFGTALAGLVAQAANEGALDAIAIDIPIGLPTDGVRAADAAARRTLGRRGAAVFTTLVRRAVRVVECHPEISFMAMNDGRPVAAGKKTWAGVMRRIELLAREGIDLDGELGRAGRAGAPDDILDAAAAAWTARRVAVGMASAVPMQQDQPRDTALIHY